MVIIVPKWAVRVTFASGGTVALSISDHHLSNVLRKLTEIQFEEPVASLTITAPVAQPAQTSHTTGLP